MSLYAIWDNLYSFLVGTTDSPGGGGDSNVKTMAGQDTYTYQTDRYVYLESYTINGISTTISK